MKGRPPIRPDATNVRAKVMRSQYRTYRLPLINLVRGTLVSDNHAAFRYFACTLQPDPSTLIESHRMVEACPLYHDVFPVNGSIRNYQKKEWHAQHERNIDFLLRQS
jgi:hypothetical protein